MRVESNHRSGAQNLVYLPLYDTSITLTQELKLLISRKLVGSLLLTIGRNEVRKTSSIYDLLLYCCGSQIRTDVIWLMRPSWHHLQSIPQFKICAEDGTQTRYNLLNGNQICDHSHLFCI